MPTNLEERPGGPIGGARWWSRLRFLLRIPTPVIFVGSITLAITVLWVQGSLREAILAIAGADVGILAIAAPVYIGSLALLCYRWHVLVIMAQGRSDLPKASEAFLTSVVINYAAPIGLAVPSRAALTKRALGLGAEATGTIAIWEIGMDVIVLGSGTVLWLFLAEGSLGAVRAELSDSIRLYAVVAAVLIVAGSVGLIWLLKSSPRRTRFVPAIQRMLLAPQARPGTAMLALATTTAYWIIQGIVLSLLLRSLSVDHSFEFVLGLTSLPILVGMLSPIPGGAVVREALMYVVARLADVPGDPVVAAAVVYRFALFAAIPILYVTTRWWIRHRIETVALTDPGSHNG